MPPPTHYVRLGRSIEGPYAPEEVHRRLGLGLLSMLHEVSTDQVNWRPLASEPDAFAVEANGTGLPAEADDDWLEGLATHAGDTLREAAPAAPGIAATSFARSTAAAAAGLLAATGAVLLADPGPRATAGAGCSVWIVAGVTVAGGVAVADATRRRQLALAAAGVAGAASLGLVAARPHVFAALPLLPGLAWCAATRIGQHFHRCMPARDPTGAAVLVAGVFVTLAALAATPGTTLPHAAGYLPSLLLAVAVSGIALGRPTAPLVPLAAAAAAALVGAAHLRANGNTVTALVGAAVGLTAAAALLAAARLEAAPDPLSVVVHDAPSSAAPLPEPRPSA